MKTLFYFIFGMLTVLITGFYLVEHHGTEIIQEHILERIQFTDLKQIYHYSKIAVCVTYLLSIIIWIYQQGANAAHEMHNESVTNQNKENE